VDRDFNNLQSSVDELKSLAVSGLSTANKPSDIEALSTSLLGKKGKLTELMKDLKNLSPESRKEAGALLNHAKTNIESLLEQKLVELKSKETLIKLEKDWIDVTLPVNSSLPSFGVGTIHPLSQVQKELERIFAGLGFEVVDGPEVESEYYNFDALNIPAEHPAREMQDTIWLENNSLLRTQTSAIQVRALENKKPPLRIVAPGRCFRYERIDATHEHTFYQMEGMMIDKM
jgi:phenylalanyl-tRNA synthetase alpha chain